MDQATYDERMRRLQRQAYGADASEGERAAALAELEAMRREHEADLPETSGAEAALTEAPPAPSPVAATARRWRWAIAAAAATLLIGVAVGWQAGAWVTVGDQAPAVPSTSRGHGASLIPLADTAAMTLFDTEATSVDVPPDAYPRDSIAPTEYRRLLTRSDGVSLYVARLHGDAAVCAVVSLPGEFTASRCTHDGMFPRAGLWVEVFVGGDLGLIRGAIQPSGVAELTPVGYVPGPLPTADG